MFNEFSVLSDAALLSAIAELQKYIDDWHDYRMGDLDDNGHVLEYRISDDYALDDFMRRIHEMTKEAELRGLEILP